MRNGYEGKMRGGLAAFIGDLCPLPADAAGDVGDLHALGLQLIPDAVGLGEVFGLLGVGRARIRASTWGSSRRPR